MVVGQMALYTFQKAPEMLDALSEHCDALFLLFDSRGDTELFKYAQSLPKTKDIAILKEPWNRWNWREMMVRQLDNLFPDLVLTLDEDEKYDMYLNNDIEQFMKGSCDLMMFDYRMITEDRRPVAKYPGSPHCKAFKWRQGITYKPYKGNAIPFTYRTSSRQWYRAKSVIEHYCFFTREMEKAKHLHL